MSKRRLTKRRLHKRRLYKRRCLYTIARMIRQFSVGPLGENVYIIEHENSPLVIVDPGFESRKILETALESLQKTSAPSVLIACTHGHLDHTAAISELIAGLKTDNIPFRICAHKADEDYFGAKAFETNHRIFSGIQALGYFTRFFAPVPDVNIWLAHDDMLPGTEIKVLHTPGHTRGGVCFLAEGGSALISGDTLFLDGRGRTDNFDSDESDLVNSIRERLLCLPDSVRVWPGHGEPTTIGHERRGFG